MFRSLLRTWGVFFENLGERKKVIGAFSKITGKKLRRWAGLFLRFNIKYLKKKAEEEEGEGHEAEAEKPLLFKNDLGCCFNICSEEEDEKKPYKDYIKSQNRGKSYEKEDEVEVGELRKQDQLYEKLGGGWEPYKKQGKGYEDKGQGLRFIKEVFRAVGCPRTGGRIDDLDKVEKRGRDKGVEEDEEVDYFNI